MDHEDVPCSPKLRDWPLNSPGDHTTLNYMKERIYVIVELEVPKKACFYIYVNCCPGPTGFAVREAKEVL
jgi:hypothetical protein